MKLWQLRLLRDTSHRFRLTFAALLKLKAACRRLDCATLARGHDWRKSVSGEPGDGKRFCTRCGKLA